MVWIMTLATAVAAMEVIVVMAKAETTQEMQGTEGRAIQATLVVEGMEESLMVLVGLEEGLEEGLTALLGQTDRRWRRHSL